MFRLGSRDTWTLSEDAHPPVDFAVRMLRRDGLRMPPFDAHPDGDGSLRALGLTAEMWRDWLDALVEGRARIGDLAAGPLEWMLEPAVRLELVRILRQPGSFCPGSEALRARLDAAWQALEQDEEAWMRRMTVPDEIHRRHGGNGLWKALKPYRGRLPPLELLPVDYPSPVVMAVPPATCVIGLPSPDISPSIFRDLVLAGAEALAAPSRGSG